MKQSYALCFLIIAQTMVAFNIVVSKCLLTHIPMLAVLTIRFSIAALSLGLIHGMFRHQHPPLSDLLKALSLQDMLIITAQALTAGVLFNGLMLTGLHDTHANAAGIITSMLPAVIALFSWVFLKTPFTKHTLICIFFATLGLSVIALDPTKAGRAMHSLKGDLFILMALIPEASYYILCQRYPNKLPVFLISAIMNGFNAIILCPMLYHAHIPLHNISIHDALTLLGIGLTSGLFYIFWLTGATHVDTMLASLSTASMPVATVVLAYFLLSEPMTYFQCLGMGFVMTSIVIYARRG